MEINRITKYRLELTGFATLGILIAHCLSPAAYIVEIQRLFSCCVEMFLILSGIGCYYSIQNRSVEKFFQRRFMRLIPAYLMVICTYGYYMCSRFSQPLWTFIQRSEAFISLIGYGEISGWFVVAITLFYLLTPLLNKLIQKQYYYGFWLMIIIWIISAQLEFYTTGPLYMFNNFVIVRLPAYIFGMVLGCLLKKNSELSLSRKSICIGTIVSLMLYAANALFNTTDFGLIMKIVNTPLAFFIALLLTLLLEKRKSLTLSFLGNISLEVYLIFEKVLSVFSWDIGLVGGYIGTNCIAILVTSIAASIIRGVCVGIEKVLTVK